MVHSSRLAACAAVVTAFIYAAPAASASPFTFVRIGDLDGFGFATPGLVRATPAPHTTPADTNLNGLLEVGEFLMESLRELDKVAFVRFASVYRDFKDVDQFMATLKGLLETRE